jgi:hypothetical protein
VEETEETEKMTRYPVSRDRRYTVTKEYTGHISGKPVWVARFEGGWQAEIRGTKAASGSCWTSEPFYLESIE